MHKKYRVLTLECATVPNALAALLLHVRDTTNRQPHLYLEWTEGHPAANFLTFMMFGVGEVAPVTREVLRRSEPDRDRRLTSMPDDRRERFGHQPHLEGRTG